MPNRKNLVILVAEDHPVNRKVLSLLLESFGVAADFANDGEQAIEAATQFNYGLILMDCMMPVIDGFEAAFEIRKFEFHKTRHTPIIACTALDKDTIIDQCVRAGMNDYIGKPIDREILRGNSEMAQVCRQLEQESEEQDWPEVEKLYLALGLAFARVRGCLQHKELLMTEIGKRQ